MHDVQAFTTVEVKACRIQQMGCYNIYGSVTNPGCNLVLVGKVYTIGV